MRGRPILLLALAVGLSAPLATRAQGIMKCQDAQGQWHYGDEASAACGRGPVIELNRQGVQTGEIPPPPTPTDAAQQTAQTQQQEAQAARDKRLLASYSSTSDITYVRDLRLKEIDSQLQANEATLKSLQMSLTGMQARGADKQQISDLEGQIAQHQAAIDKMHKEREAVQARFAADLKRFEELKKAQSAPPPRP